MKKALIIILVFISFSVSAQWDSVKFQGESFDSIALAGNTIWVKPSTGLDSVLICGEYYKIVVIGTQSWLQRNLHCNDSGGGIYSYNNDTGLSNVYGYLYTFAAAQRIDTLIAGWHLPSDAEWTTLTTFLGGESIAGGKLKEEGTTHWYTPNTGAINEVGFTALPGGWSENNLFYHVGYIGYWWSNTPDPTNNPTIYKWIRIMYYSLNKVQRDSRGYYNKMSVRLIKD